MIAGVQHCICGDSAYIFLASLQTGHGAWPDRAEGERTSDLAMSRMREAVKKGFKEVKQQFPTPDFKRKLSIRETTVGSQ